MYVGARIIGLFAYSLWTLDFVTNISYKAFTKAFRISFVLTVCILYVFVFQREVRFHSLRYSLENIFIPKPITYTPPIHLGPILTSTLPAPLFTAKAVLAKDKLTDKVLYSKNPNMQLAPASTTKLLTALVAMDIYDGEKILKVPNECTQVNSTRAFIGSNQIYVADDLIKGLLVASAGDAACVLANAEGKGDDFVALMNTKAMELGMINSRFSNPIGLDSLPAYHHSTPVDLLTLAKYATTNDLISDSVKSKEFTLFSADKLYSVNLYNTNRLLWEIPQSVGVKTGTTTDAGEVLIYEYKDTEYEKETGASKDVLIVVMGSTDRFGDTKNILNWVLGSYTFY